MTRGGEGVHRNRTDDGDEEGKTTKKQYLNNIQLMAKTYYIRSLLEQSCPVWNSGLTEENIHYLERIQKSACKLILQDSYKSYDKALKLLELENLVDRRESLCL